METKTAFRKYIVYFSTEHGGFGGWNGGYAENEKQAKKEMREKLGAKLYSKIDWKQTKWGKEAEEVEPSLLSLFY